MRHRRHWHTYWRVQLKNLSTWTNIHTPASDRPLFSFIFSHYRRFFFTERNYTQTALTCLIGPQWNPRQRTFTALIYSPPKDKRDMYYIISSSEDSHTLRNNCPAPFFHPPEQTRAALYTTVLNTMYTRFIMLDCSFQMIEISSSTYL